MGTGGGPSVALSSFSSAGAGHGHGASLSHKGTLSSGGHSVAQTYKRPTTGGLPVAAMPYPGHGGCLAVNVTTISTTHSAGIGPSPGYYSRDGAASTVGTFPRSGGKNTDHRCRLIGMTMRGMKNGKCGRTRFDAI